MIRIDFILRLFFSIPLMPSSYEKKSGKMQERRDLFPVKVSSSYNDDSAELYT